MSLALHVLQVIMVILLIHYEAGNCSENDVSDSMRSFFIVNIILLCFMIGHKLWGLSQIANVNDPKHCYSCVMLFLELALTGVAVAGMVLFVNNKPCLSERSMIQAVFVLYLVFTWLAAGPYLIAFTLVLIYLICCFGFVLARIRNQRRAGGNSHKGLEPSLMNQLRVINYDKEFFTKVKDCAICIDEFKSGDKIIPLPCDLRHQYHEKCIKDWLKSNNICPICRKVLGKDLMKTLPGKDTLMKKIKQLNYEENP